MRFLVVIACAFAVCAAQNVDPKQAKILKEQRFNAGDGRAGSAFATEDGTIFKEEADINGNRIGQYSYIGDDGQTYTVRYSAGKDGFRILDGAHIPSTGADAAAFDADYEAELEAAQPVQEVRAQPVQQVQQVAQPAFRAQPVVQQAQPSIDYDAIPVDPNFNPFVNPHDPTHRDFRFNKNAAAHAPNSPLSRAASVVPDCADCAGVNPFINPFDASHQSVQHLLGVQQPARTVAQPAGQLAGHLAGHQAGAFRTVVQPTALPARPKPVSVAQRPAVRKLADQSPLRQPTLPPAIKNFFPPGQLKLNRFETGFNFDFES